MDCTDRPERDIVMSVIATAEFPSVKNLTREQRQLLMLELVKAWFDDAGWPAPFVVRDGEEILGVFHPEWKRPAQTTVPDFPPEFVEELRRRYREIVDGTGELLTTEQFLNLGLSELDRMSHVQ
jgi:hypothetical protein